VLVIRRIHVRYRLLVRDLDERTRGRIDRAMDIHVGHCPVARTIGGCVEIFTEMTLVEAE
jgi:hypothetical protein